jgi:hypothetical protein
VDPFDVFLWVFRGIAVVIVLAWVRALLTVRDKPQNWIPAGYERLPIRLNRDRYRAAAIVGIAAGIGVLLFSLVVPAIA